MVFSENFLDEIEVIYQDIYFGLKFLDFSFVLNFARFLLIFGLLFCFINFLVIWFRERND